MLPNKLNSNLGFFVYKSAVYNLKLKQNKVKLNKQNKIFFFFWDGYSLHITLCHGM